MANVKISGLTSAVTLSGSEELPIVQSGNTVKTTTQDVANLVPPVTLPFTLLSNSFNISGGSVSNITLKNTTTETFINFLIGGASNEWIIVNPASGIFTTNKTWGTSVNVLTTTGIITGVPNRVNSSNFIFAFYDNTGTAVDLTTITTTYRILTNIFIYT